jgi:hypothetical protein
VDGVDAVGATNGGRAASDFAEVANKQILLTMGWPPLTDDYSKQITAPPDKKITPSMTEVSLIVAFNHLPKCDL